MNAYPLDALEVIGVQQLAGPPVEYFMIPGGEAGTEATVAKMKPLILQGSVHPEVVELARGIVSRVTPQDYRSEIDALFWWVKEHVRYVQDPLVMEQIQHPHFTLLVSGNGDCDDLVVSILALGMAIGHGALLRAVKADPRRPQDFSHVYPMLGYRDGARDAWVPVDVVARSAFPGWEPDAARVYGVRDWHIVGP